MKKFLSQKSVMIIFLILAILFGVFYAYIELQPVSYESEYTYYGDFLGLGDDSTVINIIPMDDTYAKLSVELDGATMDFELWTIRDGDKIRFLDTMKDVPDIIKSTYTLMSETEYKEYVNNLKNNSTEWENFWRDGNDLAWIDQYTIFINGKNAFCLDGYMYAVLGLFIEIALIVFAVLSIVNYCKLKNSPVKFTKRRIAIEFFLVLNMIFNFYTIIPIIIGILTFKKLQKATSRQEMREWGVWSLFCCSFISGILILCMQDDDLNIVVENKLDNNSQDENIIIE